MVQPDPSLRLPRPFGRYILHETIGRGGMAEVFRAEFQGPAGFRKNVALKLLHSDGIQKDQRGEELVHEARISASLHHRHIVDIYELGLVYAVEVDPDRKVRIRMTLTSPMCPVAETLPGEVEAKAAAVEGVDSAEIDLVWEPPWEPSMMSEAAKLTLGF